MTEWPYVVNVVFRIAKNHGDMVNKVTFVHFRGEFAPAWIRPCLLHTFAMFYQTCTIFNIL